MREAQLEKRKERRRPAQSEARLLLEGPPAQEVRGRLMDLSNSGFRLAHHCATLCPGDEVRFHHQTRQGSARVIWTRILTGGIESGFYILDSREIAQKPARGR